MKNFVHKRHFHSILISNGNSLTWMLWTWPCNYLLNFKISMIYDAFFWNAYFMTQPATQLQFPSSVFVDDLMHFLRQSNLTMGIKRWLCPLRVTHIGHWCKKCDTVGATEISMLQIGFHCDLLWSQEVSIKKPPAKNQNYLIKNRKQTFNAEQVAIWVVWDVTLSPDKQFLPPCSPMMAPWTCKSHPRNCKLQLHCHSAVHTYRN